MTPTLLLEDPEGATLSRLAAEAAGAAPADSGAAEAPASGSPWIAPAPAPLRMRLFCLPYAGGMSENVYARCTYRTTIRAQGGCVRLPSSAPPAKLVDTESLQLADGGRGARQLHEVDARNQCRAALPQQ